MRPRVDLSFELLDNVGEAVGVIGSDGIRLHANPLARAILGRLRPREEGVPFAAIDWGAVDVAGEPVPAAQLPIEITRTTGQPCSDAEFGFPGADGAMRWLRISTLPLSGEGPPYTVMVSFVDLTEERDASAGLGRDLLRYRTAIEALHEGVIIRDAGGRVVVANPRAASLLGLAVEQMLGRTVMGAELEIVRLDGSPWPEEEHPALQVLATGQPQRSTLMGIHPPQGGLRWLRVNVMPLFAADGTVDGVVTTFVDESEQISNRQALDQATQMFSTAFHAAPVGMALVDLDGGFMEVNRSLCLLTGYSETELLARTFQEITHPDDLDADLEYLRRLVAGEIESYKMEKRYYTSGGALIWINLHVSMVRAPDGRPERFISQIEDITERKRMEQALQRLADHDPLTELWNRRRFEEELHRQVGRCQRYGERAALFLLDLDDFKQVNDTLGHKAGDDVLRTVARTMRQRLRATDSLARLGGDEFAVIAAHVTPDEASALADELAQSIRSTPIVLRDREISATASIGVALLDAGVQDDEAALMAADIAMYRAKAAGRDRTIMQPPGEPTAAPETMPAVEPAGSPIRVLHCDDSAPYRRLIEVMLESVPDIELVASVDEHPVAVQEAQRLQPDVVLLDARVPGGTDQAVTALRAVAPQARVVVLSGLQDPDNVLRRAADGFILKTLGFVEITEEIRRIRGSAAGAPAPAGQEAVYGRGADAGASIETVRRIYEAFARRDIEDALTYTSDDVEFFPHGTQSLVGRAEPYRGHEGLREYFADARRVWKDLTLIATDFRATAGGVVVFGHVEGETEEGRLRRQVVWVWQVRAGLAVSMRVSDIGETAPAP